MSYLSTIIQDCPALQFQVNEVFNDGNSQFIAEPLPLLEFLASQANNAGLSQQVGGRNGKRRTVEVTYFPRLLESTVQSGIADCSAGSVEGNGITSYSIDDTTAVHRKISFSATDLADACNNNAQYAAERILALIDVVERDLATQVATDVAALKGKWANTVTVDAQDNLEVDITLASGDISPIVHQVINRATRKTLFPNHVIIAGDELVNYYERTIAGCCSNQGLDLADMFARYGRAVMYDDRLATALGGDEFGLAIGVGSIALLNYTESGWKQGMPQEAFIGSNYAQMMVVSPRTGIPMDLKISDNCGTITISVTGNVKAVGLPDDLFPTGDKYDGVNFVAGLEAV